MNPYEREIDHGSFDEALATKRDAERYRWLRMQNWHDSALCVVCEPKNAVRPGSYCPSAELLDEAIDHAMQAAGETP